MKRETGNRKQRAESREVTLIMFYDRTKIGDLLVICWRLIFAGNKLLKVVIGYQEKMGITNKHEN